MALTKQKENFVQDEMNLAREALSLQKSIQQLIGRWNQESFSEDITNNDLTESEKYAHLTNTELANAITALAAIDTALGDYVSGQSVNLLKMVG